jgi:hypothetical protein
MVNQVCIRIKKTQTANRTNNLKVNVELHNPILLLKGKDNLLKQVHFYELHCHQIYLRGREFRSQHKYETRKDKYTNEYIEYELISFT